MALAMSIMALTEGEVVSIEEEEASNNMGYQH
jgi:hypothetical protein